VVVEGVVTLKPDDSFVEVEPMVARPMSWGEMGRVMLEEDGRRAPQSAGCPSDLVANAGRSG
jgi:hypothetical protein